MTGVDFENYLLRIRFNGPDIEQTADYNPDLEDRTPHEIRNGRQKLKCSVIYSPNDAIERITSIDEASVFELRTITVESFQVDGRTIRLKEPLRLHEQLDTAAESLIHVRYPDLNLSVFAEFQDDMEELVLGELANKWQWIVESDDELTEDALEVKRRFLSIVEEG